MRLLMLNSTNTATDTVGKNKKGSQSDKKKDEAQVDWRITRRGVLSSNPLFSLMGIGGNFRRLTGKCSHLDNIGYHHNKYECQGTSQHLRKSMILQRGTVLAAAVELELVWAVVSEMAVE